MTAEPPRLFDQVKNVARLKHFSIRTEKSYLYYIRDFILFHNKQHPKNMGTSEIREYLTHLAVNKKSPLRPKMLPCVRFYFCTAAYY